MDSESKTNDKTKDFMEWLCVHASNMAGEAADVEAYGRDCENANGELETADEYLENDTIEDVFMSYMHELHDAKGSAENARDAADTLLDALKSYESDVQEAMEHFRKDTKAKFDEDEYAEKFF